MHGHRKSPESVATLGRSEGGVDQRSLIPKSDYLKISCSVIARLPRIERTDMS